MLDTYKAVIASQFEAAFCTLNACIDQCPATDWDAPVGNLAFCQVVFHTLFFADCYLGPDSASLKEQAFHREHPDFFRDYEEMEPRRQVLLYEKPDIQAYLECCRQKAAEVIAAEAADTLKARCGFEWLTISRAELYIYNIRHIQSHAAQLSLRLRINNDTNIPWVGTGWKSL